MSIKNKWLFQLACASMTLGVCLGAKYGHKGQLDEDSENLFNKTMLYNLSNSAGLIACSLISSGSIPFKVAVAGFIGGQLLFTAPLFVYAINGRSATFAKIIPLGGVSTMVAWPALIFA